MSHKSCIALFVALAVQFQALASDTGVFQLGTVLVTAKRPEVGEIPSEQVSSVVTAGDIRRFDRLTVGDALNLLSGVAVTTNLRNEQTVYMRGYDPRQTPLFIDGIPVYVPYDGYVDFGRFGTSDLAGIQVAKGFSSVAYGPNTLGGAINLISRRPTRGFEGDVTIGVGQSNARRAEANVGSRQERWYVQTGVSHRDADGFRMSSDFQPTATEDGRTRNNSYFRDDKVSLKVGFTPSGDDEYALTYLQQNGRKGQPPSTDPASARYWQWPYWDKESLYFISRTGLGAHESLRLRLYLDKFDNEVDTFTDASYSVLRTSGPGSVSTGRSIYQDRTFGGSVEIESRRVAGNTVRLIAQYKRDQHEETDANAAIGADFSDTLRTFAAEDAVALGDRTILSVGFSRHSLDPDRVYKSGTGPAYTLPGRQSATDPQIGLFHDLSPSTRLYATFADKTRLPTLKDRYSQRLNTYVENPHLRAEQARNIEVGYQGRPWDAAQAEFALFWNRIEDKIQSVNLNGAATCSSTNLCQQQNVGKVRIAGAEAGLRSAFGAAWELGGNATFLRLRNESDPAVRLTGIPQAKLTLFGIWRPAETLDITAFGEQFSGRWANNTVKVGGFAVLNLKLTWRPARNVSTEAGVSNLFDKNYPLDFGFPSPGRTLFATASYRF